MELWLQQFLDMLPYAILFGFSFGTSGSKQQAGQGIAPYYGWQVSSALNPSIQDLSTRGYQSVMTTPTPTSGTFGMAPATDDAVKQMVNLAVNQTSGDYGARGYLSPENRGAIVGSAVQNMLPQLLPNIQQYQQYLQQFPFLRTAAAGQTLQPGISSLGGTSSGSSSSFGLGISGSKGSGADASSGVGMLMG